MPPLKTGVQYHLLTKIRLLFQAGVIFVVLLALILLIGNWMAVKEELAYRIQAPRNSSTINTPAHITVVHLSPPSTPKRIKSTPISETPRIIIPDIQVDAPVQLNIPGEKTEDFLPSGITHLEGSAKFGAVGNVFLTGHSSDYPWRFDKYAAVFALTPHLKRGQVIYLQNAGHSYTYVVTGTEIVQPDEVSITDQTSTPVLTLMTCYPIGTTQERFVVHASLAG